MKKKILFKPLKRLIRLLIDLAINERDCLCEFNSLAITIYNICKIWIRTLGTKKKKKRERLRVSTKPLKLAGPFRQINLKPDKMEQIGQFCLAYYKVQTPLMVGKGKGEVRFNEMF